MDTPTFLKLTDAKCTKLLDKHFKLDQFSNYKKVLTKCHMEAAKYDAIEVDKIQLYMEDFIDHLNQTPHFQKEKITRRPTKNSK